MMKKKKQLLKNDFLKTCKHEKFTSAASRDPKPHHEPGAKAEHGLVIDMRKFMSCCVKTIT